MRVFDEDSPPENYKDFRKEILRTIEEAQIETEEEEFPTALFMVDRENNGKIVYVSDLDEEFEPDTPVEYIIQTHFPLMVQQNNSKFFAFVFQGMRWIDNEDGDEVVAILSGSIDNMDIYFAEIIRDEEEEFCELEPWEKESVSNFGDLVVPFRRSICPQG
jgi:hypothetical protein